MEIIHSFGKTKTLSLRKEIRWIGASILFVKFICEYNVEKLATKMRIKIVRFIVSILFKDKKNHEKENTGLLLL